MARASGAWAGAPASSSPAPCLLSSLPAPSSPSSSSRWEPFPAAALLVLLTPSAYAWADGAGSAQHFCLNRCFYAECWTWRRTFTPEPQNRSARECLAPYSAPASHRAPPCRPPGPPPSLLRCPLACPSPGASTPVPRAPPAGPDPLCSLSGQQGLSHTSGLSLASPAPCPLSPPSPPLGSPHPWAGRGSLPCVFACLCFVS